MLVNAALIRVLCARFDVLEEDERQIVLCDANALVADREEQRKRGRAVPCTRGEADLDLFARRRELDRVREQIVHDLTKPPRVAHAAARRLDRRIDVMLEKYPFLSAICCTFSAQSRTSDGSESGACSKGALLPSSKRFTSSVSSTRASR